MSNEDTHLIHMRMYLEKVRGKCVMTFDIPNTRGPHSYIVTGASTEIKNLAKRFVEREGDEHGRLEIAQVEAFIQQNSKDYTFTPPEQ